MSDYIDTREGWREVTSPDGAELILFARGNGSAIKSWVRDEPVPPLPTEPGYYVAERPDYGGGPVVVELLHSPAGQWVDAGDRQYLATADVQEMGELARLERRRDTAKAVLDRLFAAMQSNGMVPGRALSEAMREFGVDS